MGLKYYSKKLIDTYIINKVKNMELPYFEQSPIVRKRLIFSGRVQKVKFRLEVSELAKRLNLTGWVKNRNDKKVHCEIQGENEKINFLIKHLKSLKRASVQEVEIIEMNILDGDIDFVIIRE